MKQQNSEASGWSSKDAEFSVRNQVCGDIGSFAVWQAAVNHEQLKDSAGDTPKERRRTREPKPGTKLPPKSGEELRLELDDMMRLIDQALENNAEILENGHIQIQKAASSPRP